MIILTDDNKIVVAIGQVAEMTENGVQVDGGTIYGSHLNLTVSNVESIPQGVSPQKYCYASESGFTLNPDYVEIKTPQQEIAELKEKIALMQSALDEVTLNGGTV